MAEIYLDHNATTPLAPEVLEAMLPILRGVHGNPSCGHRMGREARALIDDARRELSAGVDDSRRVNPGRIHAQWSRSTILASNSAWAASAPSTEASPSSFHTF